MSAEPLYRVLPCRDGACAIATRETLRSLRQAGDTTAVPGAVLLPGSLARDTLGDAELPLYGRSIALTAADLRRLGCREESYCFTHYGPPAQEKPANEDFALCGRLYTDANVVGARFTILADGISNGFAFPQRGAQLSCFAAYQCLRDLWADDWSNPERLIDDKDVEHFRERLAARLVSAFAEDHAHVSNDLVEPSHIDPKVWRERFRDHPSRWYGNTLLVAFVSTRGGFVLFIGDGAVVLLKGDVGAAQQIRRSADDAQLDAYVTTEITASRFAGATISVQENTPYLEIITATDGLDRTFARAGRPLTDLFGADRSLAAAAEEIASLETRYPEEVDIDNYSVGRVFLELTPSAHGRLVGEEPEPTASPDRALLSGARAPAQRRSPAPAHAATDEDGSSARSSGKRALRAHHSLPAAPFAPEAAAQRALPAATRAPPPIVPAPRDQRHRPAPDAAAPLPSDAVTRALVPAAVGAFAGIGIVVIALVLLEAFRYDAPEVEERAVDGPVDEPEVRTMPTEDEVAREAAPSDGLESAPADRRAPVPGEAGTAEHDDAATIAPTDGPELEPGGRDASPATDAAGGATEPEHGASDGGDEGEAASVGARDAERDVPPVNDAAPPDLPPALGPAERPTPSAESDGTVEDGGELGASPSGGTGDAAPADLPPAEAVPAEAGEGRDGPPADTSWLPRL